jgi:hypothetical protein
VGQPISKFEEQNFGRGDYLLDPKHQLKWCLRTSSALAAIGLEI